MSMSSLSGSTSQIGIFPSLTHVLFMFTAFVSFVSALYSDYHYPYS